MKIILLLIFIFLLVKSPIALVLGGVLYYLYYWLFATDSTKSPEPKSAHQKPVNSQDFTDLAILRAEIDWLLAMGTLTQEEAASYYQKIDQVTNQLLDDKAIKPGNFLWLERRDAGWQLLKQHSDAKLLLPPWAEPEVIEEEPAQPAQQADSPPQIVQPLKAREITRELPETTATPAASIAEPDIIEPTPPVDDERQTPAFVKPSLDFSAEEKVLPKTLAEPVAPQPQPEARHQDDLSVFAWQPQEPGAWETAMAKLSGWHALAVPFLWQNIGWFIGVFCFIGGSVFLVSYSTGYARNLASFITLFIFTLFTLWSGYQIRRKRPELETSSHVIFILSMLLVPLTTNTLVGLLLSGERVWLSLCMLFVALVAFFFAVTLTSGVMDRSLQQRLPLMFLALSFAQFLLVPLQVFPYWPAVMVTHLLVLVLLSYAIHLSFSDWLEAIFIARRKVAYFAAGLLIYAAAVASVVLTWGGEHEIKLPEGYGGFYLMLLCVLLFYVDAQLKKWLEHNVSLSRFCFLLYGLSAVALLLVFPQQDMATATLSLAIGLYGLVVWQYLTLIPLYLLLLCCCWLYGLLVLRGFAPEFNFLLAFPFLYGLFSSARWGLQQQRAQHLAIIIYRVLWVLLVTLLGRSLLYGQPGWLALATTVIAGSLIYRVLESIPGHLFMGKTTPTTPVNWRKPHSLLHTYWFYSLPLTTLLALVYAPTTVILDADYQLTLGVLAVAFLCAYQGLRLFTGCLPDDDVMQLEMLLNSAMLYMVFAVWRLLSLDESQQWVCLVLLAAMLLWLSFRLLLQWLFYCTLLALGFAGMLFKSTYFPEPSTGLLEMLVSLVIWFILVKNDHSMANGIAPLQRQSAQAKAALLPTFKLLWFCTVNPKQEIADD